MLRRQVRQSLRPEAKHLLVQPGGCFEKKLLVPGPVLQALLGDGMVELLQTETGLQYAWTSRVSSAEHWPTLLALWPVTDPVRSRIAALADRSFLHTQSEQELHVFSLWQLACCHHASMESLVRQERRACVALAHRICCRLPPRARRDRQ